MIEYVPILSHEELSVLSISFVAIGNTSHVYHIASAAAAFSFMKDVEVIIYIPESQLSIVDHIRQLVNLNKCNISVLKPSRFKRVTYWIRKKQFFRMHLIKRHHRKILSHDIVITTDFCQPLLDYRQGDFPLIIHTGHGSGDRSYSFSAAQKGYDVVSVPGKKYLDRLLNDVGVSEEKLVISGYPKFDISRKVTKTALFDNSNPVFIYTPHFNTVESSIIPFSTKILDFFLENKQLNLIYTPHCETSLQLIHTFLSDAHRSASNILIDIDPWSEPRTDMTYIMSADAYIGDVSSQVYEFLLHPRPCLFLNAFNADWRDDPSFSCWHLGQVIESPDQFPSAVLKLLDTYSVEDRSRQEAAFEYAFGKVSDNEGEFMAKQLMAKIAKLL